MSAEESPVFPLLSESSFSGQELLLALKKGETRWLFWYPYKRSSLDASRRPAGRGTGRKVRLDLGPQRIVEHWMQTTERTAE
jgi:hypothetical protein